MKNRILYIAIGLIVMFALMKQCESNDNKKFRDKIDKLEKQNDSLIKDSELKLILISELNDTIKSKENLLSSYKLKIDSLKRKRNEIQDTVDNFNDVQLDSILTNYRHPNRN
jgi:hypothetical protein